MAFEKIGFPGYMVQRDKVTPKPHTRIRSTEKLRMNQQAGMQFLLKGKYDD